MSQPAEPGPASPPDADPASNRSRIAAIYTGLALAGLLAGIITGRVTGTGSPPQAAVRASEVMSTSTPAPSATVSPTPSATPASSPTPAATKPSPSPTPTKTKPPNYEPIPTGATTDQNKDLDFGFLTGVQKNGDLVTISFDRADFYTGELAAKKNGGKAPDNDYLISNEVPTIRTFQVDLPKAPLVGVTRLVTAPNGATQQRLDADTFVANATRALASGLGIPVWVRHHGDRTGEITSLAEQYIP